MEFGAGAALNAEIGPEDLRAKGHVDHLKRGFAGMLAGEAGMAFGVPVLGQDDSGEIVFHQGVDARHDLIPAIDCKGAARAEVILQVDDDEGVVGAGLVEGHGGSPRVLGL